MEDSDYEGLLLNGEPVTGEVVMCNKEVLKLRPESMSWGEFFRLLRTVKLVDLPDECNKR